MRRSDGHPSRGPLTEPRGRARAGPREQRPIPFALALARAAAPYLRKLERDHARGVLARALRKRKRWRKADVVRLLDIGAAAGRPRPAALRQIKKLLEAKSSDRGVVDLTPSLPEAIGSILKFARRFGSDTPPAEQRRVWRNFFKKTRWFALMVEAAVRGERELVAKAATAEQSVAKAAGISAAQVHRLCAQVRAEGPPDEPAMTAAELAQHLEKGPSLA
jgi:hypothetical protein